MIIKKITNVDHSVSVYCINTKSIVINGSKHYAYERGEREGADGLSQSDSCVEAPSHD